MRQTAEETEELKKLILEKAREVFVDKGYPATRMQDIADAAKVSRGPLYYHYKNKSELFYQALKESCQTHYEVAINLFSRDMPFIDKIREEFLFCTSESHVSFSSLTNSLVTSGDPEFDSIKQLLNDTLEQLYAVEYASAQKAFERGELKQDADIGRLVSCIFSCYGLFLTNKRNSMSGNILPSFSLTSDDLINFVIRSLAREFFV